MTRSECRMEETSPPHTQASSKAGTIESTALSPQFVCF